MPNITQQRGMWEAWNCVTPRADAAPGWVSLSTQWSPEPSVGNSLNGVLPQEGRSQDSQRTGQGRARSPSA